MTPPLPHTASWFRSRSAGVIAWLLVIVAVFVVSQHTGDVLGFLPYLLLLACPLMHFFHRGHRHRHPRDSESPPGSAGER